MMVYSWWTRLCANRFKTDIIRIIRLWRRQSHWFDQSAARNGNGYTFSVYSLVIMSYLRVLEWLQLKGQAKLSEPYKNQQAELRLRQIFRAHEISLYKVEAGRNNWNSWSWSHWFLQTINADLSFHSWIRTTRWGQYIHILNDLNYYRRFHEQAFTWLRCRESASVVKALYRCFLPTAGLSFAWLDGNFVLIAMGVVSFKRYFLSSRFAT